MFCESKWYGGVHTPEYINAFSSLFLCVVGIVGFATSDVMLHPPFALLCYGLLFTMGVGSFMHHWHSRQDVFWQRVDFYPMMWLTVLCCSVLLMDVIRLVRRRRTRQLLSGAMMLLNCAYVMAGVSTDDGRVQDILFGTAWLLCYVWLAVAYHFSSSSPPLPPSPPDDAEEEEEKVEDDGHLPRRLAYRLDDASVRWTDQTRAQFRRLAALAFLPAVGGSIAWLATEGTCTPANAAHIGWVHGLVWHTGVAYSSWHLMQCKIVLTADWLRARVTAIERVGPFMVCRLDHM